MPRFTITEFFPSLTDSVLHFRSYHKIGLAHMNQCINLILTLYKYTLTLICLSK